MNKKISFLRAEKEFNVTISEAARQGMTTARHMLRHLGIAPELAARPEEERMPLPRRDPDGFTSHMWPWPTP